MGKLYKLPPVNEVGETGEVIPAPVVPTPPEDVYPRPRPPSNGGGGGGGTGGDSGSGGGGKRLVCVTSGGGLEIGRGTETRCFWVNN